jgi:quinol monooxygenase YgiN
MKILTKSKEIYWVLVLKISASKEAEFKALSAKLIESTKEEAGALNYEWSLTEDGGTCHIYERYADSAAVKVHLQRSLELVAQIMTVATPQSFALYGASEAEVKAMFSDLNPVFTKPLGGFGR